MNLVDDLEQQAATLRRLLGACADELTQVIRSLTDDELLELTRAAAGLARTAQRVETVAAAVVAERSTPQAGHEGLAQSQGHRNATDMLQTLTGGSRANTQRKMRVGKSVLDAVAPASVPAWHAPLGAAVVSGRLSVAQSDAIQAGLGLPPAPGTAELDQARVTLATRALTGEAPPLVEADGYPAELLALTYVVTPKAARLAAEETIREAWSIAAAELVDEAALRTVEELRAESRLIRDQLDPDGAERRFLERFEKRSFRRWTDADGLQRASIVFDDEGGALVASIFDTALRPRRGGPRFVDSDEAARARELADDPRTNDQLGYDLLLDLLGSGAIADARTVLGARQAGVRVVRVEPGQAHTEDGLTTLPVTAVDQRICNTGAVDVGLDASGDPLSLGRTRRLFTSAQRVALAVRDGGCRWQGCDRPASYCEAHHIDPFSEGGRTDVDRGILLCRFHHMQLHHGGWRITRDGQRDFVLHDPGGNQTVLTPRLALRRAFAGVAPPARRFRPEHAQADAPPGA